MAVPTLEAFLERFPEMVIHSVPVIEDALLVSGKLCAAEVWDDLHDSGVGYYAAHLLDLRNREIGAMVGQAVTGISGTGVNATFYGQQYEALRSTLPTVGLVF
jgi:hypothetical protein